MRSGLILAGGRSTRFGERDKALATVAEEPMIGAVADRLAGVVDEVIVNCRPDQTEALGAALGGREYRLAVDPTPDCGPVAGICTGAHEASGEFLAVVGCDMPAIDPGLLEHCFAAAGAGAVPRSMGKEQPLHAVYDRHVARVCAEATLESGSRRLFDFLGRVDPVRVDTANLPHVDRLAFHDVDTRSDLAAVTEAVCE